MRNHSLVNITSGSRWSKRIHMHAKSCGWPRHKANMQWYYLYSFPAVLLSFHYENLSRIVEKNYLVGSPDSNSNPVCFFTVLKIIQCFCLCFCNQWHGSDSWLAEVKGLHKTALAFILRRTRKGTHSVVLALGRPRLLFLWSPNITSWENHSAWTS